VLLTSFDPFTRRVFGATNGNGTKAWTIIPMDAIRRKDEVLLRFDLPGVDPQSIDVTVDRNVLKVSAQRTEESVEGENAITRERVTGAFARRVYLGDTLDSGKIEASYANGVLAVRLPLLEKAQPRKIEIHTDSKKKITA
jgi:HSP20 family protein